MTALLQAGVVPAHPGQGSEHGSGLRLEFAGHSVLVFAVGPVLVAAVGPVLVAAVGPVLVAAVGPELAVAVGPGLHAMVYSDLLDRHSHQRLVHVEHCPDFHRRRLVHLRRRCQLDKELEKLGKV